MPDHSGIYPNRCYMCGIIGYTGTEEAVPLLLTGLRALEYRGYDSAGVALSSRDGIDVVRTKGRVDELEKKLGQTAREHGQTCGIGHTRWATHGEPSERNAHPHSGGALVLVHNGIIENYAEIEDMLRGHGYEFISDTDTEAAAKLIDCFYAETGDPLKAIFGATRLMRGSYAFGMIFCGAEDAIYAVRHDSPLIVAHNREGGFIASDVTAVLPHSRSYYLLDRGVVAVVKKDGVRFFDETLGEVEQTLTHADWDAEEAQKGGFPHFMLKEIFEEPDAIRRTVGGRLSEIFLPNPIADGIDPKRLANVENIHIVACGTAMHAGLVGKTMIESLAGVSTCVDVASEFRYREPILCSDDIVMLISQSGETADTLAALRYAKARGVYTLALVNVIGSTIAREADSVLYTRAGPEISVASTKAYSVQCALLCLFAAELAAKKGRLGEEDASAFCRALSEDVPRAVLKTLEKNDEIRAAARELAAAEHLFFIGRGIDSALCTEASLKLKEISYIHSEAYPAGELKHGTISLIEEGTPVVAVMTQASLAEKMISGIREVRARGAKTLVFTTADLAKRFEIPADGIIALPDADERLSFFEVATAVQLLAYHVAAERGCDIDKPRNLAKSVTVE